MKDTETSRDSGVLSSPLSFLRSGNFNWYNAEFVSRDNYGHYWLSRATDATNSNSLSFFNTYLNPQFSNGRGFGFAVRCVNTSPNPSPLSLILAIL